MSLIMSDAQHYNALRCAECRYAECRVLFTIRLSDTMLNVSAECHYAECRYAEGRGALKSQTFSLFFIWSQSYNAVFSLFQNKIERLSLPMFSGKSNLCK